MLDENFDLFLIEVNMSPNMKFEEGKIFNMYMYQSVLYNLFNLVGVGTTYMKNSFKFPDPETYTMALYSNGIGVRPDICLSDECLNCGEEKCEICWQCMGEEEKADLLQAYSEQLNIGEFKRLFPPEKDFMDQVDETFLKSLSKENRKHLDWYVEMCKIKKNKKFC